MSPEPDPAEEIYAYHEGLGRGVWVARSALRQLGGQGWVETEPPAAPVLEGAGDEQVYAYHAGLHRSVWVARSALQQQLSLQGWVEAKPPPPRKLDADGALLPREPEPTEPEPTEPTDDAPADAPADDAAPKRKRRARAAKTPEE